MPDNTAKIEAGLEQEAQKLSQNTNLQKNEIREIVAKAKELIRADTRSQLHSLVASIDAEQELTPAVKLEINKTLVRAIKAFAPDKLIREIKSKGHDFEEDDPDNDESKLKQNTVFQHLMEKFKEKITCDESAPAKTYAAWINKAMIPAIATNVAAYKGLFSTRMNITNVDQMFQRLDDPASGVGSFEKWFKDKEKTEYDAWQKEKQEPPGGPEAPAKSLADQKTELTQKLAAAKQELGEIAGFPNIQPKLTEIETAVQRAALQTIGALTSRIDAVKTFGLKVKAKYDELTQMEAELVNLAKKDQLNAKIQALKEKVKQAPDENGLTALEQETAALKAEILSAAQQGRQAAEAAMAEADTGDMPALTKAKKYIDQLAPGPTKTAIAGLLGALTALAAALANLPFIGSWIRSKFISNKELAERGDKTAEKRVKVEDELRIFGLNRIIANHIADEKVSALIAQAKTDKTKLPGSADEQDKLVKLAEHLESLGGLTSQMTLCDFINSQSYKRPAGEAPAGQPEPQRAAPTVDPQALERQRMQAMDSNLSQYKAAAIVLTAAAGLDFTVSYVNQSAMEQASCSLRQDKLTIKGKIYNITLGSSKLKSIQIQGPAESGKVLIEVEKQTPKTEMSQKDFFSHLDALAKLPQTHEIPLANGNKITLQAA